MARRSGARQWKQQHSTRGVLLFFFLLLLLPFCISSSSGNSMHTIFSVCFSTILFCFLEWLTIDFFLSPSTSSPSSHDEMKAEQRSRVRQRKCSLQIHANWEIPCATTTKVVEESQSNEMNGWM